MSTDADVKIELGPSATYDCGCCGKQSETVHGFLYEPDGSASVYFAGYTAGHADRQANLALSMGAWGGGHYAS